MNVFTVTLEFNASLLNKNMNSCNLKTLIFNLKHLKFSVNKCINWIVDVINKIMVLKPKMT